MLADQDRRANAGRKHPNNRTLSSSETGAFRAGFALLLAGEGQLGQDLGYRNASRAEIPVDARSAVFTGQIDDPQDRITANLFSKTARQSQVLERVHKEWHKVSGSLFNSGVAQRTVGEELAAFSAGILPEVHPDPPLLPPGPHSGLLIVG